MRNFFLLVAVVAGGIWLAVHFGVIGDPTSDLKAQGHGMMKSASDQEFKDAQPKSAPAP